MWQSAIATLRVRQSRAGRGRIPTSRWLGAWVATILLLQALNLHLGVAWPYLVGVFGVLVNGFAFFLLLLLGREGESVVAG